MKFYLVNNESRAQHIENDMDKSSPGSFRKTTASYTETDTSGSTINPVCEVDTSASNFTTFKASFIAEFGKYPETKSSQYYNADYINLVRFMLNPAGNHFTVPVKPENAEKLFEIFGQTLATASKFEGSDLYVLDLDFTDGELTPTEKSQLRKYVEYVQTKFGTSLNLTDMGPDLASLYQFALENQSAEAPAPRAPAPRSPAPIVVPEITQPASSSVTWKSVFTGSDTDVNVIPAALFDPWAVATGFDNALKGDQFSSYDIYRDYIIQNGVVDQDVLLTIQAELTEGPSYTSTRWTDYATHFSGSGTTGETFKKTAAGKASRAIDSALDYFSTNVTVAEFTFNSPEHGALNITAYVDANPYSGTMIFEISNAAGVKSRYIRHHNDTEFAVLGNTDALGLDQTEIAQIQDVITASISANEATAIRSDIYLETFGD